MIDFKTAEMLIHKSYPNYTIVKFIDYKTWFIFLLTPTDSDEFPTFFRVEKSSGKVEDFQPWDLPDPEDFENAFLV